MANPIELKNDGKQFERFETMARKLVSVPKKDIQEAAPSYIVIGDSMLLYKLVRYDKSSNTAHVKLFKNLDTYRSDESYRETQIRDWN